jgi:FAD/FMN-containing dehydrogenase
MTQAQATTTLDGQALAALRACLRGTFVLPGEPEYDRARLVWNGMIDRYPALIVRCTGAADVIAAVRFAREHELLAAVRGGGHNVAGNGTCDGGMVIDLSRMRGVRVDPLRRTAWAEGGATWGDFDHETAAFGLGCTGGAVSTTGIAGLTLGGGVGWLARRLGLSCDNLLAVDVVTADGRFLTASAREHEDLFWGVRGGGGNFGIITSFTYQVHPVGDVLGGMVVHPIEGARDLLHFFSAYARDAPEELSCLFFFFVAPPVPFLPVHVHGRPVASVVACWSGSPAVGEAALQPLRQFGRPLVDTIAPMPYTAMQRLIESGAVPRQNNYWKAGFFRELDDGAMATITAHISAVTTPGPFLEIFQFNGAVNRVAPEATAFAHRHANFDVTIGAKWLEPAEEAAQIGWVRACYAALEPHMTGGVYVNYLGTEGEERVRAAYGPNYERMVALKRTYDPTNFFRLNQNITP